VSTVHVRSTVSVGGDRHPPVILVHGAANSGMVWRFWQGELAGRGCSSHVLDLRGHGESTPVDLSNTRMGDYAADVVMVARELRRPAVLLGWSMGGLVAMMAAASCGALACIGLAPSTPVRLSDPSVSLASLPCPLLVVTSTGDSQWPRTRYESLHLARTHIEVDGASHWGLVLNRRVLPELVTPVVDWVSKTAA
jgi:alpha-beta hydrolase superfamily lysophospholipase